MKLTKYDQSCIIVENDGRKMVVDPAEFSTLIPITGDVDVILVTHKHSDHLTPDVLKKFLAANPDVAVLTVADNQDIGPTQVVKAGDKLSIGNFELEFFGENHVPIVADDVPCQNIGVVINGSIVHPGDSFDVPPLTPKILCVAVSAPWLKTYETMQYITKLRPEIVVPIHDALFSPVGKAINNNWVQKACDEVGATYRLLEPGEGLGEI